jgi:hypothetical protein
LLYGQDSASLFTLAARDVPINFPPSAAIHRPSSVHAATHHRSSTSNCYDLALFNAMPFSQYC